MSAPKSGLYLIRSLTHPDALVGCLPADGLSFPKRIVRLPRGISHSDSHWIVDRVESDERVILLTAGTLVVQHEDRVYGVGAPPPGMWHITAREDHGPNVYTIETSSREDGWVFPDADDNGEPDFQVRIKPLQPQFTPNALWEITPITQM